MTLVARRCFRCGLPLTDAASMDHGVGPICRKLDNAALAQLIPSDVPAALASFAKLDASALPAETVATVLNVEAALNAEDAGKVTDWRENVKRIEWVLSFGISSYNANAFVGVVRALGYVTLANLWTGAGTAGHGSQTLFHAGRVYFIGPKCKGGVSALKAIPGAKFTYSAPSEIGGGAAWSVPADQATPLVRAVQSYWAGVEVESLVEALTAAKAWIAAQPAVVAPVVEAPKSAPVATVPLISVVEDMGILKVATPFSKAFVAGIKEKIPKGDRAWDPLSRVWRVKVAHKATVDTLIAQCYKVGPGVVAA